MSGKTIIGGFVEISIGGSKVELTSSSLSAPLNFAMSQGSAITVKLSDLTTWLINEGFLQSGSTISFPGLTAPDPTLIIKDVKFSTSGTLYLKLEIKFGGTEGSGWTPISALSGFSLDTVGIEVNYSKLPNITSLSATSGAVGTPVTVTGTFLSDITSAKFGDTSVPVSDITANEGSTTVTLKVPSDTPVSATPVNVTVTNKFGTSNTSPFTVTAPS